MAPGEVELAQYELVITPAHSRRVWTLPQWDPSDDDRGSSSRWGLLQIQRATFFPSDLGLRAFRAGEGPADVAALHAVRHSEGLLAKEYVILRQRVPRVEPSVEQEGNFFSPKCGAAQSWGDSFRKGRADQPMAPRRVASAGGRLGMGSVPRVQTGGLLGAAGGGTLLVEDPQLVATLRGAHSGSHYILASCAPKAPTHADSAAAEVELTVGAQMPGRWKRRGCSPPKDQDVVGCGDSSSVGPMQEMSLGGGWAGSMKQVLRKRPKGTLNGTVNAAGDGAVGPTSPPSTARAAGAGKGVWLPAWQPGVLLQQGLWKGADAYHALQPTETAGGAPSLTSKGSASSMLTAGGWEAARRQAQMHLAGCWGAGGYAMRGVDSEDPAETAGADGADGAVAVGWTRDPPAVPTGADLPVAQPHVYHRDATDSLQGTDSEDGVEPSCLPFPVHSAASRDINPRAALGRFGGRSSLLGGFRSMNPHSDSSPAICGSNVPASPKDAGTFSPKVSAKIKERLLSPPPFRWAPTRHDDPVQAFVGTPELAIRFYRPGRGRGLVPYSRAMGPGDLCSAPPLRQTTDWVVEGLPPSFFQEASPSLGLLDSTASAQSMEAESLARGEMELSERREPPSRPSMFLGEKGAVDANLKSGLNCLLCIYGAMPSRPALQMLGELAPAPGARTISLTALVDHSQMSDLEAFTFCLARADSLVAGGLQAHL